MYVIYLKKGYFYIWLIIILSQFLFLKFDKIKMKIYIYKQVSYNISKKIKIFI